VAALDFLLTRELLHHHSSEKEQTKRWAERCTDSDAASWPIYKYKYMQVYNTTQITHHFHPTIHFTKHHKVAA
jgi:ABC-type oligopeptide transport system substrate-binding subunit